MTPLEPPRTVTLWHCFTCRSTFRFNIGAGHLPHEGRGKCEDRPLPFEYELRGPAHAAAE